MVATELQGARAYWQVCHSTSSSDASKNEVVPCAVAFDSYGVETTQAAVPTYPDGYAPSVVGQVWGTSAEMQTWFGSAAWKVSWADETGQMNGDRSVVMSVCRYVGMSCVFTR